jgi:hypothetical protein
MPKNSHKKKHYDPIRYARMLRTASIVGVSTRQVRRVCEGENQNEVIIDTMVRLVEAEEIIDSLLVQEVKKKLPL